MSERSDLAACRGAMRTGSHSFFAASLLLPRAAREPATALYAFCRAADDAVDGAGAQGVADAIASLRTRLDAIYAGRPEGALDRAMTALVTRHDVPREQLDQLVEGFGWDEEGRRYDDFDGVIAYAMRVAGSVGLMMARIMGVRSTAGLDAAAALGCAMQLTNIARDVGDDARIGRLYLPLNWMRGAGLDPDEWLAAPVFNEALGSVVRRLLAEADRLYAQAAVGIALLPGRCRPAIRAASALYCAIGGEVARCGYDSVSSRAVVPWRRKLSLLGGALLAGPVSVWSRVDDRIGWVLELFARLENEAGERGMRNGSMSCVAADENRSRSTLSCMASAGLSNSRVASVERA